MPDVNAPYKIGCAVVGSTRPFRCWETARDLERAVEVARKWTAGSCLDVIVVDRSGRCVARIPRDH